MKGFWDSLIALLDDLQTKGFMRKNWRTQIEVANSIEDIYNMLSK